MNAWVDLLLKRFFRWTVLAVVLIIVGAGYALLLAGKISTIQTVSRSQQEQVKRELSTTKQLRDSLQVSLKKYKSIFTESALSKINSVLPAKAEFPTLLLTMQNVTAAAGYTLDSLTISPVAVASSTDPLVKTQGIISQITTIPSLRAYDLSIAVSGSGGYTEYKKLIRSLEESQQLFDVLSLNYAASAPGAGGAANSSPSFSLTIRTYSFTPKIAQ